MAQRPVIGIVGGVGPFAGLDLQQKILSQTVARRDQEHLTVISWSQPSTIADRTDYLLGKTAVNPAYALADQVRVLVQAGATVVGIPAVFLQRHFPHITQLGLLSTTGTYLAGFYPALLEPAGFTVHLPPRSMQEQLVHPAVYDPEYGIKARGRATEQARRQLETAVGRLKTAGAGAILLGCTEMPLAFTAPKADDMLIIDPTLILARALIAAVAPEQLRPFIT